MEVEGVEHNSQAGFAIVILSLKAKAWLMVRTMIALTMIAES